MGRKGNTVLLITAFAGAAYLATKALKKKYDHHLAQAIVSINDGEYSAAIEYLSQIPVKNNDILLLLSDCQYKLHNVTDALAYLNRCIRNSRERGTIFGTVRETVLGFLSGDTAIKHEELKELIEKRLTISTENAMHMEAFKDAFLLSVMGDDVKYKNISTEYLKTCSLERSRTYQITGWASTINFSDFFQTLFFIENIKDPAVVFLSSGEYEKCFEYVRDGNTDFHKFLKGCFFYVNGDIRSAAAEFIGESYLYSRMMFIFIKATIRPNFMVLPVLEEVNQSKVGAGEEMPELAESSGRSFDAQQNIGNHSNTDNSTSSSNKDVTRDSSDKSFSLQNLGGNSKRQKDRGERGSKKGFALAGNPAKRLSKYEQNILGELLNSEDLTVQFYVSKIFEGLKLVEMQLQSINNCLVNRKTAPGMGQKIIIHIKQDRQQEAVNLIKEAVDTFPDDMNLHCIAIEYFLHIGDYQRSAELLQQIECFYREDPRVFIFKYLLSKAAGNADIGYLRDGIRADSKYFKTYIHLGNHLMGDEESLKIYQGALGCARSFDELFTVFQVLTVVEAEQELSEEYPKLFSR